MQKFLRRIHPVTGAMAILCIACFMTASVFAELYGSPQTLAVIRHAILWGLLVLIPCLILTGLSGYQATGTAPRGLALTKFKRMRIIGINGVCILVPCAFFLALRASELKLDRLFYGVQLIELLAGTTNLALLCINFRDGLRMARS
ncbi:hypothetical protein [Acetobacter persici]|uniref:hypothetical protein n=1 Tax=Acetobacter persici TaxID=1076596 RepID=UPI0039E7D828